MINFEEIFDIPDAHTLTQITYTQKGSMARDETWEHEEYDTNNKLIAKYKSWSHMDFRTMKPDNGWAKYSPTGKLIKKTEGLAIN